MRTVFTLLNYLLWLGVVVLAIMNMNDVCHINLINAEASAFIAQYLHINAPVSAIYLKTPILYLILFALGEIAGICYLMPLYKSGQEKLQAYKRELERGSVTNSSSASKIEVLENKIRVLEKALDDALNK